MIYDQSIERRIKMVNRQLYKLVLYVTLSNLSIPIAILPSNALSKITPIATHRFDERNLPVPLNPFN